MSFFKQIWKDQNGNTQVEYALLCVFVSVACISAIDNLGKDVTKLFDFVAAQVARAQTGKLQNSDSSMVDPTKG